jgi:hypothetical protein
MSGHGNHDKSVADDPKAELRKLAFAAERAQEDYAAEAERLLGVLNGDEEYDPASLAEIESELEDARQEFRNAAAAYRDGSLPTSDPTVLVLTLRRDPESYSGLKSLPV